MIVPEWIGSITLGQLLTIITLIGGFVATSKKIAPFLNSVRNLMSDVMGEPARPGVPARPGILERLQQLEASQALIANQIDALRADVMNKHKEDRKEDSHA